MMASIATLGLFATVAPSADARSVRRPKPTRTTTTLALTTTTTGQHKIIDWYNANATNSGDATWVSTTGRFNGAFTANSADWTAPALRSCRR